MSGSNVGSSSNDTRVPAVVTTGLIVVSAIFPVLSLTSIVLRYMSRMKSRSGFKADDWWIVAAWIITLGLSINVWVFAGLAGVDYYKISPLVGVSKSLQCLLISSVILQVSLSVVKISILLFYKRIFVTEKFQIVGWIAIAIVSAWGIIFFFLVLLEGNPISASWTGIGSYRFDTVAIGLSQVGSSIALDVLVLCLPLPLIFSLHLPLQKKIAVMLIFWLGAFCCVAAIVRLVLLQESLSKVASDDNMVGSQSKQFIFMILEPNCSIIAACLPCYGHLIAGVRAPESIIRSVRSILSLHSSTGRGNSANSSLSSIRRTRADPHQMKTSSGSEVNLTLPTYAEGEEESNAKTQQNNVVNINERTFNASYDDEDYDDGGGEIEAMYPQGIRMTTRIGVTHSG